MKSIDQRKRRKVTRMREKGAGLAGGRTDGRTEDFLRSSKREIDASIWNQLINRLSGVRAASVT